MSVPEGYRVRPVELADGPALGAAHVQAWQEAYRGIMDDTILRALDPVDRGARWMRAISSMPPTQRTFVADHVETGALVGFATVDDSRDPEPVTPRELWAINVLQDHHGTGVAQALLDAALGDEDASLWVVDRNARAIAFYRRNGFEPDGGTKRDEHLGVDEIRMSRRSSQ